MSLDIVFALASSLAPFRVTTVIDDARPVATPDLARVLVVALALDLLPLLRNPSHYPPSLLPFLIFIDLTISTCQARPSATWPCGLCTAYKGDGRSGEPLPHGAAFWRRNSRMHDSTHLPASRRPASRCSSSACSRASVVSRDGTGIGTGNIGT